MDQGWCQRDAEHLCVLELALLVGPDMEDAPLRVLVKNAEIALASLPVFLGALQLYGTPEHTATWRRMSRLATTPESRQRMASLASQGEGFDTAEMDPADLAELLTPEDFRSLAAAATAESRGEFATALALLRGVPMRTDDAWVDSLRMLCESDGPPDPLLLGRFSCQAAYRSILQAPGFHEVIAHFSTVVRIASGDALASLREDPMPMAAHHPVVQDALLFDVGGLSSYVMGTLARDVVEQVPGIEDWGDALPGVLRIKADLGGGLIRCQSLVTRDEVVVSAPGLAGAEPVGTCLFGRLVDITGREHPFFALRPLGLDTVTATRVAAVITAGGGAEDRITELCRGVAAASASAAADVA